VWEVEELKLKRWAMGRIVLMGIAIVVVGARSVSADTVFASRQEFEAALGVFRVITFDAEQGFAVGPIGEFDDGRITARSDASGYFGPASVGTLLSVPGLALTGRDALGESTRTNVRLLFAEPQFAIGFDSFESPVTTWTFTYADGTMGEYILDGDELISGNGTFMGLISDRAIANVSFLGAIRDDPHNPGEQPHYIDNLTLVPEPGSVVLTVVALVALLAVGLRNFSANTSCFTELISAC
jgi:hypothetical protein